MKRLSAVFEVFCLWAVGQARILDQSALPVAIDSENFVEPIEGLERKKEIRKCYNIEKG
jgi:hypothetical protein